MRRRLACWQDKYIQKKTWCEMSKDITLTREEAEELLRWAKEVQKWSDAIHDDHPNCYGLVKMMQSKLSAAEDENKKYFRRCDGCVGKGYYGSDFDKCTECDGAGAPDS